MAQIFNTETSPIFGTMLLEASAGTGKTYALEHMVARLIGREKNALPLEKILVVTFTNKAAREMKERIRRIISQRANEAVGHKQAYADALASFDRAPIYTIHGFCRMVLSSWPFEASVPFEQDIVSGYEIEIEETRNWLTSSSAQEYLNDPKVKAAWNRSGSVENFINAIVTSLTDSSTPAGAEILPDRDELEVFNSFAEDAELPNGRLAVAANNLFNLSDTDLSVSVSDVFNAAKMRKQSSSINKILAHMKACTGIRGLTELEDWIFGDPAGLDIKNHFSDLLFAANKIKTADSEFFNTLKDFIEIIDPIIEFRPNDNSKKALSLIRKYQENAFHYRIQKILKPRIEARKNNLGCWNFSDLIKRTAEAVADLKSPLKTVLQERFKVAIIDEFQDTDPLQWQMFRNLFYTTDHTLILIGDPKQSIYGFRGTGLTTYRAASALVSENQRFRLDTNWRSIPELVDVVNILFDPIFNSRYAQTFSNLEPIGYTPSKAGKPVSRQLQWHDADKPLSLFTVEDESEAAERIVFEIRALLNRKSGAFWRSNENSYPVEPSDIAILVRNAVQETDMIDRLQELNIPARRYRDVSIYNQPIIPMLMILLEAIREPRNMHFLKSVLLGDFFRLPPHLLLQFEESGYLIGFQEWNMRLKDIFNAGQSARALAKFFIDAAKMGQWAKESGYNDEADRLSRPWTIRVLSEPGGIRLWQDWNLIGEIIQERQSAGMRDITRIISWLKNSTSGETSVDPEGNSDQIRMTDESPSVTVMTMHSAKGLEFPLVFLHGGFKGATRRSDASVAPYRFESETSLVIDRLCREKYYQAYCAHSWEEEKRLWYVAFTRASSKLWASVLTGGTKSPTQLDSLWGLATGLIDGNANLPPHDSKEPDAEKLRKQIIQKLTNDFQELIAMTGQLSESEVYPQPLAHGNRKPGKSAHLPASYTGSRDPVTSSFTSLVHYSETPGPGGDKDRIVRDDDANTSGSNILLPTEGGQEFGNLVHACMELCDINLATDEEEWHTDEETDKLFADQSARYFQPGWYTSRSADLKTLVRQGLCALIPGLGKISDLSDDCYRREIEFQMHIPRHSQLRLPISNPLDNTDRLMQLGKGFLMGFIDLLAYKDGQWWVVDWKTNLPRPGQSWHDSMDMHHYHLQYELYLLALCHTLFAGWGRPVNWEKEIGGAAYVFLRGLKSAEPNNQGIVYQKPTIERMHSLADLTGCSHIVN